jgi:aromatic ring-opening dioxygenase LigB subunit
VLQLLGVIVPHAPILAPALESPEVADAARRIYKEIEALDLPETVIVVSPHAPRTGVYAQLAGNLDEFGAPGIHAEAADANGLAAKLARLWKRSLLDDPADHGILVPLLLGCVGAATIGVGLGEGESLDELEEDASALADALQELDEPIAVVASINGARGLTPRAPLTERAGSKMLDEALANALAREPDRIQAVARELAQTEASCCFGPLIAVTRARPRATFDIRAREDPVGVSYMVAVTKGDS